jgi:hypothetical protein
MIDLAKPISGIVRPGRWAQKRVCENFFAELLQRHSMTAEAAIESPKAKLSIRPLTVE